jgi:two-component system sensor histidine kinase VicK
MRPTRGIGGYVAVLRDVTEQEKLNQARRDFVANVSHELRTPLTTIKSYIDAVREEGLDEPTRARFLDVIAHEVDRMVRLTHDLLQLSGLETRSRSIHRAPVELSAWLTQCVERFRMHAESIGVDLTLEMDGPVVVEGDRDLLDRVIDNLLGNALKYTTSGGRVAVRLRTEEGSARIEVSDTGIGIPAEDLPHVFERFYRVDKARSRRMGGSGLGLALAREITEWHGGTIRIESEVGRGTTVIVTLPATARGETAVCESGL